MTKALRYGNPDEPSLAAGVALILARLHAELGERAKGSAVARRAHEEYPSCPELGLLRVQLGDDDYAILASSIQAAPELAFTAMLTVPDEFEIAANSDALFSTILSVTSESKEHIAAVQSIAFVGSGVVSDSVVAPSLRSPLNDVMDACSLLLRAPSLTETVLKDAGSQIINELSARQESIRLELDALESGALRRLRARASSLNGEIQHLEKLMRPLKSGNGYVVELAIKAQLAPLLGWQVYPNRRGHGERIGELQKILEELPPGESYSFSETDERLTADQIKRNLDEARELQKIVESNASRTVELGATRGAALALQVDALRTDLDKMNSQIQEVLEEPARRHEAMLEEVRASQEKLAGVVNELRDPSRRRRKHEPNTTAGEQWCKLTLDRLVPCWPPKCP